MTTYPPRWRVERRAVASSTLLEGMRENQVTKHTKQEHQPHFYIQGVSRRFGQISRLICSHQYKENYPWKRIPGNYFLFGFNARLHSTMGGDSDSLRAGRSGDRISVGVRYSTPVQTGPGAHPASCTIVMKAKFT